MCTEIREREREVEREREKERECVCRNTKNMRYARTKREMVDQERCTQTKWELDETKRERNKYKNLRNKEERWT
jgi:hypothetical protein